MSNILELSWVHTALVTPFNRSGKRIDYEMLRELVEYQVTHGVQGVVPVGTTGESPTLSAHEHERVIAETVDQVSGRILVIGGIGSNSTSEAIHYARENEHAGADAWLSVVPYYNKPNQEWLYQHFRAQAESTSLPIILYSIPGRCGAGVELAIPTILRLANDCPNIIGIKEAGGNLERFQAIRQALDENGLWSFSILSGDDGLTIPAMKLDSANGVISVASNIIPREMSEMVRLANTGNIAQAEVLSNRYQSLFEWLFMKGEPSPQGAKYILSHMRWLRGRFQNILRLPLVPVSETSAERLEEVIHQYHL
jgi:4-hydroxy-tetrahydrodipicolinate synthase